MLAGMNQHFLMLLPQLMRNHRSLNKLRPGTNHRNDFHFPPLNVFFHPQAKAGRTQALKYSITFFIADCMLTV